MAARITQELFDQVVAFARAEGRKATVEKFAGQLGRNLISSCLSAAGIGEHMAGRIEKDRALLARAGVKLPRARRTR